MSRRLDISALLCNDDDDQPPPRSSRPTSSASPVLARRPPPPFASSSPSQGAFVGFDALVHAATEERRRLSGGDLAQHHIHYQQPQHQQLVHHQQPPPPRLSPQFHRSPWQEEQQYAPPPRQAQSPRHSDPRDSPIDAYKSPPPRHTHPFDERSSHQMRQFQIMEDQKRKQEMELLRVQELERRRQQDLERARLQELERTKAERQELDRARRELEEERRRIEDMKQQLEAEKAQTAELARRREEEEREEGRRREAERQRLEDERRRDHEREIAARRDAERHQQRREAEMHMQRMQEDQMQHQRLYEIQRAADIERQRRQAIQLQQQQQQQQQQYFHHQQQPQAPQQHRNYEPPPRIEIPPGPQHHARQIDPSPPSKVESQSPSIPHAHLDQRPTKKPRYSDSPSLAPMVIDDKDRIARERERMTVGEIGYGRVESPVAPPPSSSSSTPSVPRRPGSGTGVRRPVSVSDLLSPEPQPPLPTPVDSHHPPLRIISRDKEPVTNAHHHHHRILSPLGRRSPPGSQAGRAKAARKSEEHAHPVAPSISASSTSSTSFTPMTTSHPPPPPPASTTLPSKKPVVKEEHVKRQKMEESPSPMLMEPKRISPSTAHVREPHTASHPAPAPPAPSRPPKERPHHSSQQHGDAHDWFLEQIDHASPPAKKDRHAPHRHTRSPSAPSQRRTVSPVVQVKKQSPSPVVQDDDVDAALEQELEELLAEVEEVAEAAPKEESMDVDSVVAELVETLEGDDDGEEEVVIKPTAREHEVEEERMPLAADVDDELLSLIDDKPPPPVSSTSARRASGSSTSVTASLAPPTARIVKQAPPSLKTASATPSSVSTSPISSLMGPGVRPEPSKPKSERGSMPPPPIVGKKEKDHEGKRQEGVEAMVPAASMTAAPKKKKDATGIKKAKVKATVADFTKGASSTTTDASQDAASAQPKSRPKVTKSKKASISSIPTKADSTVPAPATAAHNTASSSKPPTATKPANAATVGSRKHASVSSRSRSTSIMPGALEDDGVPTRASSVAQDRGKAEKQEEEEESDAANEDDRLYCVCKTRYDQERCMIACDRCDEWYHMQCLDMPENVADLVDQFFCPPCIDKNPHLNLRTTYKQRCLWGLKCPDSSSPRACHKPARGAFSKYCSDECGVKYMQSRIDTWAKKGGKKEKLWDSVKSADKREGVVVRIDDGDATSCKGESTDSLKDGQLKPSKPAKAKGDREKERLNRVLQEITQAANELRKGMEILSLREKLLEMAGERAENVGQCGWDQRLCYGDDEWVENGQSVLESYEDRDMDVDGQSDNGESDWWCAEDAGCSRHMGWQTTRFKDICKEKEKREEALQNLNARDSAARKQLEELLSPPLKKHSATATAGGANSARQERNSVVPAKGVARNGPLASANAKMANGHGQKSKAVGGEALKKGKKRKAPSS